MLWCCRSRVAILPNDNPHLLVEDDRRRHQLGTQLYGGGPEGVGSLQPMPTPHPPAAVLTGAEGDPKLADEDPRDRQFFLDLGGHAGRAQSSAAIRTARRQRYVVAHVDPRWSAPAGRLAVFGTGPSAWAFGFGRDRLGEGSSLAMPGASGRIELPPQAGVLLLEPFDPPLQPFAFALALIELALHARVLLRGWPVGVLLAARRAHTRFIGTCEILCTPDVSRRRPQRSPCASTPAAGRERGNQLRVRPSGWEAGRGG